MKGRLFDGAFTQEIECRLRGRVFSMDHMNVLKSNRDSPFNSVESGIPDYKVSIVTCSSNKVGAAHYDLNGPCDTGSRIVVKYLPEGDTTTTSFSFSEHAEDWIVAKDRQWLEKNNEN